MYESLLEVAPEVLVVLLSAIGTTVLAALGVAAEYNSVQTYIHSGNVMAVWYAVVGGILLAFAWKLAHNTLWARIQGARA